MNKTTNSTLSDQNEIVINKDSSTSTFLIQPKSLASSSIAAAAARLITHPLDTIRLRIQTQLNSSPKSLRQIIPTSASEFTLVYQSHYSLVYLLYLSIYHLMKLLNGFGLRSLLILIGLHLHHHLR